MNKIECEYNFSELSAFFWHLSLSSSYFFGLNYYKRWSLLCLDARRYKTNQKDFRMKKGLANIKNKKILMGLLLAALAAGCQKEDRIAVIDFGTENGLGPIPTEQQIRDSLAKPDVDGVVLRYGYDKTLKNAPSYFKKAADMLEERMAFAPDRVRGDGLIVTLNSNVKPGENKAGMYEEDSIRFVKLGFKPCSPLSKDRVR